MQQVKEALKGNNVQNRAIKGLRRSAPFSADDLSRIIK